MAFAPADQVLEVLSSRRRFRTGAHIELLAQAVPGFARLEKSLLFKKACFYPVKKIVSQIATGGFLLDLL